MTERPRRYLSGVMISPREAAELERRFAFQELRIRMRDTDPEFYETLHAIHWMATAWQALSLERKNGASGDRPAPESDQPAQLLTRWISTGEAAARLHLSIRRVQQLVAMTGDLHGVRRSRQWLIDTESVAEYEKRRSAA